MDDLDIWRSAKVLVDKYGDDATIHAAMRADEFLAQGDMDGAATGRLVLAAVEELERTVPKGAAHWVFQKIANSLPRRGKQLAGTTGEKAPWLNYHPVTIVFAILRPWPRLPEQWTA